MRKKVEKRTSDPCSVRKATPEEIERYNTVLSRESKRMHEYKALGISYRVNMEGNFRTTAMKE